MYDIKDRVTLRQLFTKEGWNDLTGNLRNEIILKTLKDFLYIDLKFAYLAGYHYTEGDSLVFDKLTIEDRIHLNPENPSDEYVLLEIEEYVTHK